MSEAIAMAGDIGGSKSNLAFVRGTSKASEILFERTYQNHEFASLADLVRRFRSDSGLSATGACFGVAGAVVAGESFLPI